MVELKHQRIGLAAIDARMCREKINQVPRAFFDYTLSAAAGIVDIPPAVLRIMLLLVGRATSTYVSDRV